MKCKAALKVYGYGTDNISYSTCGARLQQHDLTDRQCPECFAFTRREQAGPAWPGIETLAWLNRSSEQRRDARRHKPVRRRIQHVPLHFF